MPDELLEQIWAKLTENNPACSCCNSDDEYLTRVNQIGAMIDGRRWRRIYDPGNPDGHRYETIPGEKADAGS